MLAKLVLLFSIVAFACGYSADMAEPAAAAPVQDAGPPASLQMRAVLVAGDGGLRVFDNAVASVAAWLRAHEAVPSGGITRLSAATRVLARHQAEPASWRRIMHAVAQLKPAAGQGCFVFITSHGIHGGGVALSYDDDELQPAELDRALQAGCGDAPTVAIVSACYSGGFTRPPMARPNRIVLSAARADRPSFGCGAGETYTFFDQCLLNSLRGGASWREVFQATRACVAEREQRDDETPSEPQGWFGAAAASLALPK
jgi:hypothetical protein